MMEQLLPLYQYVFMYHSLRVRRFFSLDVHIESKHFLQGLDGGYTINSIIRANETKTDLKSSTCLYFFHYTIESSLLVYGRVTTSLASGHFLHGSAPLINPESSNHSIPPTLSTLSRSIVLADSQHSVAHRKEHYPKWAPFAFSHIRVLAYLVSQSPPPTSQVEAQHFRKSSLPQLQNKGCRFCCTSQSIICRKG